MMSNKNKVEWDYSRLNQLNEETADIIIDFDEVAFRNLNENTLSSKLADAFPYIITILIIILFFLL